MFQVVQMQDRQGRASSRLETGGVTSFDDDSALDKGVLDWICVRRQSAIKRKVGSYPLLVACWRTGIDYGKSEAY